MSEYYSLQIKVIVKRLQNLYPWETGPRRVTYKTHEV